MFLDSLIFPSFPPVFPLPFSFTPLRGKVLELKITDLRLTKVFLYYKLFHSKEMSSSTEISSRPEILKHDFCCSQVLSIQKPSKIIDLFFWLPHPNCSFIINIYSTPLSICNVLELKVTDLEA